MPEVILPCPACGSNDSECIFGEDEMYSVDCGNCAMRGPAERNPDAAIAAHNTIPRALRWTHEQPKVAGWYWWRTSKGQNVNTIQIWSRSGVLGYCFDTEFITALDRGEWAGPIAPPID